MEGLYPLTFNAIYKEKLWGGQKIKTVLNKDFGNLANCGETWELSGVKGNVSIVANGPFKGRPLDQLLDEFKGELVGTSVFRQFKNEFPLLIKFIDAAEDLSIQVHPDDALAKKKHDGFGKTELWYILQADENASLISGFNRPTNKDEYLKFFEEGRLTELLNKENVHSGDVFFLPSGRVHTIGAGLLLAEIQQTSDITYRIYDFDRIDKDGNKRELHQDDALEAIDFNHYDNYKTNYKSSPNTENRLVESPFFTTNKWIIDEQTMINRSVLDCFKIYISTEGAGTINGVSMKKGSVLLIPAMIKEISVEPEGQMELLETYIEL
ncbi:MAG: type I phosphomannose isomerase catalytic subunit [Bacteroidota bacterium]